MRELFTVIRHEDSDGIKEICLIEDNEFKIKNMKNLIKLLKRQIKDLELENQITSTTKGNPQNG